MQSATQTVPVSKRLWAGRIMSAPASTVPARGRRDEVGEARTGRQGNRGTRYAETVILPLGVVLLARSST